MNITSGIRTQHLAPTLPDGRLARGQRWACPDTFSGRGGRRPDGGATAETRIRARALADELFLPVNAVAAAGVSTRLTTVSRAPTMLDHRLACIAFVAAAVAIASQMSSGTSLHQSCTTQHYYLYNNNNAEIRVYHRGLGRGQFFFLHISFDLMYVGMVII